MVRARVGAGDRSLGAGDPAGHRGGLVRPGPHASRRDAARRGDPAGARRLARGAGGHRLAMAHPANRPPDSALRRGGHPGARGAPAQRGRPPGPFALGARRPRRPGPGRGGPRRVHARWRPGCSDPRPGGQPRGRGTGTGATGRGPGHGVAPRGPCVAHRTRRVGARQRHGRRRAGRHAGGRGRTGGPARAHRGRANRRVGGSGDGALGGRAPAQSGSAAARGRGVRDEPAGRARVLLLPRGQRAPRLAGVSRRGPAAPACRADRHRVRLPCLQRSRGAHRRGWRRRVRPRGYTRQRPRAHTRRRGRRQPGVCSSVPRGAGRAR